MNFCEGLNQSLRVNSLSLSTYMLPNMLRLAAKMNISYTFLIRQGDTVHICCQCVEILYWNEKPPCFTFQCSLNARRKLSTRGQGQTEVRREESEKLSFTNSSLCITTNVSALSKRFMNLLSCYVQHIKDWFMTSIVNLKFKTAIIGNV